MISIKIEGTTIPLVGNSDFRLNKYLSDIREPEKKGGAFSKTITIPGTKEVNTLFGFIFDIRHELQGVGASNFAPDFNPNKKANAIVESDGEILLQGYIRLLKIKTEKDAITYEVIIANNVKEFFNVIQNKKLADLDLTELNHPLTRTNIENSWATSYLRNAVSESFAYGEGYVYPLFDRGPNAVKKSFIIPEFYPLIAAREIVSKIFEEAGFSFESGGFFDTAFFKGIYFDILSGNSEGLTNAQLIAREFKASRDAVNQDLVYNQRLVFNNDSSGTNFDSAGAFNTASSQWTCPVTGRYTIYLDCTFLLTFTNTSGNALAYLSINKNGKHFDAIGTNVIGKGTSSQEVRVNSAVTEYDFKAGDIIDISLYDIADKNLVEVPFAELTQIQLKANSFFQVQASQVSHNVGDNVDFQAIANKEMSQRDFILNIGKVFNLLFDDVEDNNKKLIVKTRDNYFGSTTLDWSRKIDNSRTIEKIPLGELDFKNFDFDFAEAKDISNQNYLARYNERFGSLRYVVDNDFVKATRKIDVGFAVAQSINYGSAWDAILPHIEFPGGIQDNAIRIFYYGGLKACQQFIISDSIGGTSSSFDSYPFFGHVDDPTTPTIDLGFGMPREVALGLKDGSTYTDNNSFNVYWRNTIEEISNPSGFILRAYFNLTKLDWASLKMSNKIYVENEVFRINKLEDYDPDFDGLTKVELIKAKDLGIFVPTSKGIGRGGDQANGDGQKYPLKKVGTFTPIGTSRPESKGEKPTDQGDGAFNKLKSGNVLGSSGNIGVGERVQFINSNNNIVGPGGADAILMGCFDLEIDEGGVWIENVKYEPSLSFLPFDVTASPSFLTIGTNADVTLTGNYFRSDSVVTIENGTLNTVTVNSMTEMVLNITATAAVSVETITIDGVAFSGILEYALVFDAELIPGDGTTIWYKDSALINVGLGYLEFPYNDSNWGKGAWFTGLPYPASYFEVFMSPVQLATPPSTNHYAMAGIGVPVIDIVNTFEINQGFYFASTTAHIVKNGGVVLGAAWLAGDVFKLVGNNTLGDNWDLTWIRIRSGVETTLHSASVVIPEAYDFQSNILRFFRVEDIQLKYIN
jgi:hypothetical protein